MKSAVQNVIKKESNTKIHWGSTIKIVLIKCWRLVGFTTFSYSCKFYIINKLIFPI
jgi:hypothetical protein